MPSRIPHVWSAWHWRQHRCDAVRWRAVALLASLAVAWAPRAAAQGGAYDDKVWVQAETRLDWAYPLLGKSPVDPPAALLKDYHSAAQTYELFVPDGASSGAKLPLVIFVSPSDRPVGWRFWEGTCRAQGVLFAGLREMGNGRPTAHRVRAVLDVLDDVRTRFDVDADRTYLAGFSGGALVACSTALPLPEYFGGVICAGYAVAPPESPWQLARVRDRLSIAIINGDGDPVTPLAEDFYNPWWEGLGVRVNAVTLARQGHTMPEADVFAGAFAWLEAGAGDRRAAAAKRPALRVDDAPTPDAWAQRALEDAKTQLAAGDPASLDAGLAQLEGIATRWRGAAAATEAKSLLDQYVLRPNRPWEAVRATALRESTLLKAEGLTVLAGDGRKPVRDDRGNNARLAVTLWRQLRDESDDSEFVAHAEEQIAALAEISNTTPAQAKLFPLNRVRFEMNGDVTLPAGIEHMRRALARVGYELRADESALRAAGVDFERLYHPRIRAGTLKDVDEKFFRRAGVRMQRVENVVELVPVTRN